MDGASGGRPPEFERFVARAGEGRNSLPRIVLGSLLAVAVWFAGTLALIAGAAYATTLGILPGWTGSFGADALSWLRESRFGMAVAILTLAAIWPGVWLAMRFLHRRRLNTLYGSDGRLDWAAFGRAALVTLAVALVVSLLNLLYEPSVERSSLPLSTWLALVPAMAVVLLLQTSAEEVLFRGYLLQSLAHRFRSPWIWAFAPTLVFALAHLAPGAQPWMGALIVFAIALFALAAVALVWATGNLSAAMGMHFANNLVALLFLANGTDATALSLFVMPPIEDPGWTVSDALASGLQQIVLVGAVLGLLLSRRSPLRLRGGSRGAPASPAASDAT